MRIELHILYPHRVSTHHAISHPFTIGLVSGFIALYATNIYTHRTKRRTNTDKHIHTHTHTHSYIYLETHTRGATLEDCVYGLGTQLHGTLNSTRSLFAIAHSLPLHLSIFSSPPFVLFIMLHSCRSHPASRI